MLKTVWSTNWRDHSLFEWAARSSEPHLSLASQLIIHSLLVLISLCGVRTNMSVWNLSESLSKDHRFWGEAFVGSPRKPPDRSKYVSAIWWNTRVLQQWPYIPSWECGAHSNGKSTAIIRGTATFVDGHVGHWRVSKSTEHRKRIGPRWFPTNWRFRNLSQ